MEKVERCVSVNRTLHKTLLLIGYIVMKMYNGFKRFL